MPRAKNKNKSSLFGDDGVEEVTSKSSKAVGPSRSIKEDDGAVGKIKVNQKFAERYEERKRKQELARAEELGLLPHGDDEEPDSEDLESEDEGEALTTNVDKKILATIAAIRRKDPRVYKPDAVFFEAPADDDDASDGSDAERGSDGDDGSEQKKKKKQPKKVTAKDVLRQQLMEAAERGETDAFASDDEDDGGAMSRKRLEDGDRNPKVYDSEQAELRKAFLESAAADSALDDDDDMLRVKEKKKAKKEKGKGSKKVGSVDEYGDDEEEEASVGSVDRDTLREFLRAKAAPAPASSKGKRQQQSFNSSSSSGGGGGKAIAEHADELADPDAFLDAYMRSRAWKEEEESDDDNDDDDGDDFPAAGGGGSDDGDNEGDEGAASDAGSNGKSKSKSNKKGVSWFNDDSNNVNDSTDEEELEKADAFEAAYNFRFEEPGGAEIVTHARNVEGSLRRKDTKRKDARDRRKERKEEERRAQEAETRRLMNLKRAEQKGRMSKIREVAGAGVDMDK